MRSRFTPRPSRSCSCRRRGSADCQQLPGRFYAFGSLRVASDVAQAAVRPSIYQEQPGALEYVDRSRLSARTAARTARTSGGRAARSLAPRPPRLHSPDTSRYWPHRGRARRFRVATLFMKQDESLCPGPPAPSHAAPRLSPGKRSATTMPSGRSPSYRTRAVALLTVQRRRRSVERAGSMRATRVAWRSIGRRSAATTRGSGVSPPSISPPVSLPRSVNDLRAPIDVHRGVVIHDGRRDVR
jgi:hypothetical protein